MNTFVLKVLMMTPEYVHCTQIYYIVIRPYGNSDDIPCILNYLINSNTSTVCIFRVQSHLDVSVIVYD